MSESKSDTPRTDEALSGPHGEKWTGIPDFARQLERELNEATQWRPIDSAPKDREILVWNGDSLKVSKWHPAMGDFPFRAIDGQLYGLLPTQWMPLPKPPTP